MAAFRLIGLEAVDRRLMMQTLNEAVALAEKDTPATWRRLEDLFEGACVKAHEFPPKIFSGMLLPALTKAGDKFAALEARRRSALMAVGIELYGTEHGGLRERLEELVAAHSTEKPGRIVSQIYRAARAFAAGNLQDDCALLALKAKDIWK